MCVEFGTKAPRTVSKLSESLAIKVVNWLKVKLVKRSGVRINEVQSPIFSMYINTELGV